MLSIMTRIGENSKMIITGDINQSDISGKNGLIHIKNQLQVHKYLDTISLVEFDERAVERSQVVKDVLRIWNS
jgi:phosphate starvation-inducible PhoH-like protein